MYFLHRLLGPQTRTLFYIISQTPNPIFKSDDTKGQSGSLDIGYLLNIQQIVKFIGYWILNIHQAEKKSMKNWRNGSRRDIFLFSFI